MFVERYIQKHDISIIGCEMMYLCFSPFSVGCCYNLFDYLVL